MARYAISIEGTEQLKALAEKIICCVDDITDRNAELYNIISELGGELGIYAEEISNLVFANNRAVSAAKDDIFDFCKRLNEKSEEIRNICAPISAGSGGISGTSGNTPSAAQHNTGREYARMRSSDIVPQYENINDIPEKEFKCISQYNADSDSLNDLVRAGRSSDETKLLRNMISKRELSENKTLFRQGTLADLNGLETGAADLRSLEGKIYNFSGFMSTTPDAKLPGYVSHGNVFYEISAPAGTNALDLSGLMYNEIIFDSPLCRIDHVEEKSGKYTIYVSII